MPNIPPDTRQHLVGTLGLLASDRDGERAAAALLARRLLKSCGCSWNDVIAEQVDGPKPDAPSTDRAPLWHADLQLCLRNKQQLNTWERNFIANVGGASPDALSPRQIETISAIAARLQRKRK